MTIYVYMHSYVPIITCVMVAMNRKCYVTLHQHAIGNSSSWDFFSHVNHVIVYVNLLLR